jgi:hypothetical protein
LRVAIQGAQVTSDGGLILVRDLDQRVGLSGLMQRRLSDSRWGKNLQSPLLDLLRQSIYSRPAGYWDVNDAERLRQVPTFRLIGSSKLPQRGAALNSRLQSFETELLTEAGNLAGVAALNRELIARAEAINCPRRVVLDIDSTEIPVYGEQEQSAYIGRRRGGWWRRSVPLWGVIRPRRLHRDQSWDFKPGSGAVLQQTRHRGTTDQGRQAGDSDWENGIFGRAWPRTIKPALSALLQRPWTRIGLESCSGRPIGLNTRDWNRSSNRKSRLNEPVPRNSQRLTHAPRV